MWNLGSLCLVLFIAFASCADEGTDKCINYCNDKYNPICAKNDTYTLRFVNDCKMQYENCRSDSKFKKLIEDEEECKKFENSGCAFKCSSEPKEICAYNGDEYKEFVNPCQMISANCKTSKSEYGKTIELNII